MSEESRSSKPRTAGEEIAGHDEASDLDSSLKWLDLSKVGLIQWFRPGEHHRVEEALSLMKKLGVEHLRTGVSWADCHTAAGEKWYDWLLPRLAKQVQVLPCIVYTPPSRGVSFKTSAPPRQPKDYADFIDVMITRYGECFEWMELWNEPNNTTEWDWTADPSWMIFSQMVGSVAYWARKKGKKTVLAGMSPVDPNWLELMFQRGVMQYIDVVGIHGFPGTFEFNWDGWQASVEKIKDVLERHRSSAQVWVTETGFSTWRRQERQQLRSFIKAIHAPVERVYWYSIFDLPPEQPTVEGFHSDQREYHFGLQEADGQDKLLCRLWAQGQEKLSSYRWLSRPARPFYKADHPTLITGGAGFIGTNLAHRLLKSGRKVMVLDNLSRPGVERNITWLRKMHGSAVQIDVADMRDLFAVRRAVQNCTQVFHLAAQVAVTTSLTGPRHDFDVNASGTLNLLEAIRSCENPPPLVYTSTNKVYGELGDVPLRCDNVRYRPVDRNIDRSGVNEDRRLDFHSPYGCSKGAAEQYVLDYCRTYDIPTVVFRMSCIYGPHQFGTEDQGWVAHFLISAIKGRPLSIYGDGKQVRDILFVEDLVEAFLLAQRNMLHIRGQAFNIGGGPKNTISLLELMDMIEEIRNEKLQVSFSDWRVADQRYYVSDTRKFSQATGWKPQVSAQQGVRKLYDWLVKASSVSGVKLATTKGA